MAVDLRQRAVGAADLLVNRVDDLRRETSAALVGQRQSELGQFFTPAVVAQFMAGMLELEGPEIRLLDPGAGVGSLTAAVVAELLQRSEQPSHVSVDAYEVDPQLADALHMTMKLCEEACAEAGFSFEANVVIDDFVNRSSQATLDATGIDETYNAAILNPPYRKVAADSSVRHNMRALGVEAPNLYAAFVGGTISLLEEGGEFVSITPRSFCNGTYFKGFRTYLLDRVALRRLHVFESRKRSFHDDDVLQENIIVHAVRSPVSATEVSVSHSQDATARIRARSIPMSSVVRPGDVQRFIHHVADDEGDDVAQVMATKLRTRLSTLGLTVSTGRVVDFRAKDWLRAEPERGAVPLVYPVHFDLGRVSWPLRDSKKPNAIVVNSVTRRQLVPNGTYVLVKRFSAKEERRRVVAALFEGARFPFESVGFENHLNYFHVAGGPLEEAVARGLCVFLNSSLVDSYLRQFSGHTQVNAGDLRNLGYPPLDELSDLGANFGVELTDQVAVDSAVGDLIARVEPS